MNSYIYSILYSSIDNKYEICDKNSHKGLFPNQDIFG